MTSSSITAARRRRPPLVALGAKLAAGVADACRGDAVVTMLADDHAVEGVAFGDGGIVSTLPKGAVHVSSSTIGVATSESLARAHAAAGQRYVAAPVFGRPEAAAAAKLIVLAAGEPDAVASVSRLLDAIGQRTFVMSRQPEAANLVKLSGNFLIASVIESLGEAMALVGKGGVDLKAYLDLLTSTLFSAPVYRIYGADQLAEPARLPPWTEGHSPGAGGGGHLGVTMPVADLLRERFAALISQGGEKLDWAAIGALSAR